MAHSRRPDASGPGTETARERTTLPGEGRSGGSQGGPRRAFAGLWIPGHRATGWPRPSHERGRRLVQPPTLSVCWCQNRTTCSHLTPRLVRIPVPSFTPGARWRGRPFPHHPSRRLKTAQVACPSMCPCALSEHAQKAWAHVCMCVQSGSLFSSSRGDCLEVPCSVAKGAPRPRREAKPIAKNTYYTATFCK